MYLNHLILVLAVILVSGSWCNAQRIESFDFYGAPGLSYKRTRATLHVIDQRINKEIVGHIKSNTHSKIIQIKPQKPIAELLSSYYGNVIGDEELLLVLYDFDMTYNSNQEAIASFYFDGDFYSGKDGKYKFIERVDSLYEIPLVEYAVIDLTETAWSKITTILNWYGNYHFIFNDTVYTKREAANRRTHYKMNLPIYQTTNFKKGIYYTTEQFIKHQPIDTGFVILDILQIDGSRIVHPYYLNKKGKKGDAIKSDSYFAIYDGNRWYSGDPNTRMSYDNGEFYTTKISDGMTNRALQRSALAGSVGFALGGAAGAVIGSALISQSRKSSVGKESSAYFKAKFDPQFRQFIPIERKGDL